MLAILLKQSIGTTSQHIATKEDKIGELGQREAIYQMFVVAIKEADL